jgi:hypothetical protein
VCGQEKNNASRDSEPDATNQHTADEPLATRLVHKHLQGLAPRCC